MMYRTEASNQGDYMTSDGTRCTLLCCRRVRTHAGVNIGWTAFDTLEECCKAWSLFFSPAPTESVCAPPEPSAE